MKESLRKILASCDSVAVTLDIWSDRMQRGFLGVTVHYAHDNQLFTSNLATQRITSDYHTIIREYGLEGKVKFAITENASNMKRLSPSPFHFQ